MVRISLADHLTTLRLSPPAISMVLKAAEGVYQSAQDVVAKQNKELYPNVLIYIIYISVTILPINSLFHMKLCI